MQSEPAAPFGSSGVVSPGGNLKIPLVSGPVMGKQVVLRGSEPPPPGPSEPPDEEKKPGRVVAGIVASDRITFLEKVEKLLDSDRRVRQFEEENAVLARVMARQQEEIAALRRGEKP